MEIEEKDLKNIEDQFWRLERVRENKENGGEGSSL